MNCFTLNEFASLGRITHDTLSVTIDFDGSQLGKMAPLTERAIRHVIGLSRPDEGVSEIKWEEWDTIMRQYSKQIMADDPSGKQHTLYLLYVSGFIHEMRHAHDLLGSCYGQEVLFLLLNSYQNVPFVIEDLKQRQKATGRPISLPLVLGRDQGLDATSEQVVRRYRESISRIQHLQDSEGNFTVVTVVDLLEMSACNSQLSFLSEVFGHEATFEVSCQIALSPGADKYLRTRNNVIDYMHSRGIQSGSVTDMLNYLVWASLMRVGPDGQQMSEGVSPSILFEAYIQKVVDRGNDASVEEARVSVNEVCIEWGLRTPREMYEHYLSVMGKRLESFPLEGDPLNRHECYRGLRQAFIRMNEVMQHKTDGYFTGSLYPWLLIGGNFPLVLVRTCSKGALEDFTSPGMEILTYDNWTSMDINGSILRVLSQGFGSLGDPVFENMVMDMLRKREDHNFEFRDSLF